MGIPYGKFNVGGHIWSIECYPEGYKQQCADFISFGLCLNRPAGSSDDAEGKAGYRLSILDKDGEPVHTVSCSVRTYSSRGDT
jgi:speckle-type POZ protein